MMVITTETFPKKKQALPPLIRLEYKGFVIHQQPGYRYFLIGRKNDYDYYQVPFSLAGAKAAITLMVEEKLDIAPEFDGTNLVFEPAT